MSGGAQVRIATRFRVVEIVLAVRSGTVGVVWNTRVRDSGSSWKRTKHNPNTRVEEVAVGVVWLTVADHRTRG